MREQDRIPKMLQLLGALWEKYPDCRLAQLVLNAHSATQDSGEPYFAEDEVLERGIRKLLDGPPEGGGGEQVPRAA
ncbi:MAG TPA: hypothetical protein VMB03_01945 [Bryobacteraceae bacterium]|nr:hypothetical protein [Bryobacteraceae bacterium]